MFQDAHLDDITMKKSKEKHSSNLSALGRTVTLGWGGPMVERDRLGALVWRARATLVCNNLLR